MLIAHIGPGYFAAAQSESHWQRKWNRGRRALVWIVALGSTIAPDLDVIYNTLFRGFFNHSTLWTHSLFPYVIMLFIWGLLRRAGRWPYLQLLIWLAAIGGLSHVSLDMIAHSTPLLYPFSMVMVGIPPARVVEGGLWAYVTDPIFLLEPCLLTLAGVHWLRNYSRTRRAQVAGPLVLVSGLAIFIASFMLLLPTLQKWLG